jgi:hypothetical protein
VDDLDGYRWDYGHLPDSDDLWVRVEGGKLGQPIFVRFGRQGMRYFVAALHIENGQEIKGADLRFPLAAIAEQIAREASEPGEPDLTAVRKMKEIPQAIEDWAHWRMLLDQATAVDAPPKSRGRGATPPTEDELRGFALAYIEELEIRARGAVVRASERFHMHRVTGYKWLTRCQELGLLPPREAESE